MTCIIVLLDFSVRLFCFSLWDVISSYFSLSRGKAS